MFDHGNVFLLNSALFDTLVLGVINLDTARIKLLVYVMWHSYGFIFEVVSNFGLLTRRIYGFL